MNRENHRENTALLNQKSEKSAFFFLGHSIVSLSLSRVKIIRFPFLQICAIFFYMGFTRFTSPSTFVSFFFFPVSRIMFVYLNLSH